jgi:hypothetical protein
MGGNAFFTNKKDTTKNNLSWQMIYDVYLIEDSFINERFL